LGWATRWRTREGRYLLDANPVRGYDVTPGPTPRRPVANRDRYEAVRAVSDRVTARMRRNGKQVTERSYLSEVLDIAAGTGRRLTPVCELRYMDLRLESTPTAPYGAIVWPEETDKMSRTREAPVSPGVRAALDRVIQERPGIGAAWLFPALADPTRPITRHLARAWLLTAEELAGLEKQDGSLWHAYRRGWATERKWLPDVDVAAVGGWANVATLQACYQQADPATMLRVVMEPAELREVHG
jgi:integrase